MQALHGMVEMLGAGAEVSGIDFGIDSDDRCMRSVKASAPETVQNTLVATCVFYCRCRC